MAASSTSATSLDAMEMLDIGKTCAAQHCHVHDFLPLSCVLGVMMLLLLKALLTIITFTFTRAQMPLLQPTLLLRSLETPVPRLRQG